MTQLFRLSNPTKTAPRTEVGEFDPPVLSTALYHAYDDGYSSNTARLRSIGKPLGATFIGISIVILFIGFHRYFEGQYWIIRGKFPAGRTSIAFISFLAVALIIASLVVILAVSPRAAET